MEESVNNLPPVVKGLASQGILPGDAGLVKLIQTQMSWVILTTEHAFKLKKPVDLGYVDYTTLKKRLYYCQKEVELNRRLCPDTYFGVVAVTREINRYGVNGRGEVVDYAVKMRRLPETQMLDYLLMNESANRDMLEQVADTVAAFHQEAVTSDSIAAFGSLDAIRYNTTENFEQSLKYAGCVVEPDTLNRIKYFTESFIENNAPLFNKRAKGGHIRDCHGDLHSSHVCFVNGICIFDCIEFNDRFRYSDTASEVAFLAMDLDYYGRADLSTGFVERYVKTTGDVEINALIKFYKCYRAMVRAKVNCFKLDDPYVSRAEKEQAKTNARIYFQLAESYVLDKPVLLVNVGLVGSGKTTLAKKLASRMGMVVISSDVVRKTLAGIPPTEPQPDEYNSGIYSPDFSQKTYQSMFEQAGEWLGRGVSVILDATFIRAKSRRVARDIASRSNATFGLLEYQIDDEEAHSRLVKRSTQLKNASDGRPDIYYKMKRKYEPLDETEALYRVIIDSNMPAEENIRRVREYIHLQRGLFL